MLYYLTLETFLIKTRDTLPVQFPSFIKDTKHHSIVSPFNELYERIISFVGSETKIRKGRNTFESLENKVLTSVVRP